MCVCFCVYVTISNILSVSPTFRLRFLSNTLSPRPWTHLLIISGFTWTTTFTPFVTLFFPTIPIGVLPLMEMLVWNKDRVLTCFVKFRVCVLQRQCTQKVRSQLMVFGMLPASLLLGQQTTNLDLEITVSLKRYLISLFLPVRTDFGVFLTRQTFKRLRIWKGGPKTQTVGNKLR